MARATRQTRENVMKEYNDYVAKINENLREIERNDPDSIALDKWRGFFEPIDNPSLDYNTMRKMKSMARNVYESGAVSLEGVERSRELALRTLHDEGYTYVNRKNFNSFMRFLDDARARGLGSLYSSTQIISMIYEAKKKGLTKSQIKKNIARWGDQVKRDREGKVIEQQRPKKLTIRRY